MKTAQRVGAGAGNAKLKPMPAYRRRLGELNDEFHSTGNGAALVRGRAAAVDEVVLATCHRCLCKEPGGPPGFCVAAVGGYGRQELFPFSDVDLLLLFSRQVGQGVTREQIGEFLKELWDGGLRLGHSVRLLSECGNLDPNNTEFSIALLDARFLAGDATLFARLTKEVLPKLVQRERNALLRNLTGLAELRHKKNGETIFHLEPDVKESPGGLRDFQLACWIFTILRGDDKGLPPREELPECARRDIVAAYEFVAGARAWLHLLGGRDVNSLTFDMQEQVATRSARTGGPATAEEFMRLYFRHARGLYRLAQQALRQSAAPLSTLSQWFHQRQERVSNADFVVHGGEVFLRNPVNAQRDPALWLDLFEFQARHGVSVSLETERRLQRHLEEVADWAQPARDLWTRFRRVLALPHAYTALAAMHELGLLNVLFPEFGLIDSLVIRDLYHRYTVDEHSLLTIRHLHGIRGGKARDEHEAAKTQAPGAFADLFEELHQPELLLFALLLHDLGKSDDGDHVQESLRLLAPILDRLEMDEAERETVRFLVENHLLMSSVMTTRDISEPAVVRDFAARIGTTERLQMLTLMTYADIKSVHPGALTPWKQETLWQLYVAAHNELTRQLDMDRTTPGEASTVFRPEVATFLEGFPRRYLKTHTPAEILAHYRMAEELKQNPVQLQLVNQRGHHRLLVLTRDHPFLFAAICGTLTAFGMNIVTAEAFSNRAGVILDTFRFTDLHRTLELNPDECERLQQTLRGAILGDVDIPKLLAGRADRPVLGRSSYRVETRVRFDDAASAHSTLLEVITRDRVGLLYRIANVLSAHGCNIEVVLVDTQGQKAIDVFYVTREGRPLDVEWQTAIANELRRVLE